MKQIFDIVVRQLSTINGLYVAENWGQLDLEIPPVKFPCALVDLGDADYTNCGQLSQKGDATLVVTLADTMFGGVDAATPERLKEKEFYIFDLIKSINTELHGGCSGNGNTGLVRVKTQKQQRNDGIREFSLVYKFSLSDTSATKKFSPICVQSKISIKKKTLQ